MQILRELADGTHPFTQVLNSASHPIIVVGSGILQDEGGAAVYNLTQQIAQNARVASQVRLNFDFGLFCLFFCMTKKYLVNTFA